MLLDPRNDPDSGYYKPQYPDMYESKDGPAWPVITVWLMAVFAWGALAGWVLA